MSHTWTRDALVSNASSWSGEIWRVVESTSKVSTLKLVDTLEEQAILEDILERSKPTMPPACKGLHPLLFTPFRYAPYPSGSRFRRKDQRQGAFYGSEKTETAIAELSFYRFLFFKDSPGTKPPANPVEHTAFKISASGKIVDLTVPPFSDWSKDWLCPTDYSACQDFADQARESGIQAIRYQSVRCPLKGANIVILDPAAFTCQTPLVSQTWHIFVRDAAVQAVCEMPPMKLQFGSTLFEFDPRLAQSA